MASALTPLSYVVLALIGRGGAGAHDLVRMTRTGQRLYYAGAASKIYEHPKRLEALGYVRSEKRPGRTRAKTHYTLTDAGHAALRAWLRQPSSFPRIQSEVAARVLASDLAQDPREVAASVRALRTEIATLEASIAEDERRAETLPHRERQLRLMRSLGRRLLQAHLEWIEEVERELDPAEGDAEGDSP
jgi:DNA-binding PadR family transcriptional regulator